MPVGMESEFTYEELQSLLDICINKLADSRTPRKSSNIKKVLNYQFLHKILGALTAMELAEENANRENGNREAAVEAPLATIPEGMVQETRATEVNAEGVAAPATQNPPADSDSTDTSEESIEPVYYQL